MLYTGKTVSINPDFANFSVYNCFFFKVEENVLLVQFQFILPTAHPNRFVLRKQLIKHQIFL